MLLSIVCISLVAFTSCSRIDKLTAVPEQSVQRSLWFMGVSAQKESEIYMSDIKSALGSVLSHHAHALYPVIMITGKEALIPEWMLKLNNSRRVLVLHQPVISFAEQVKRFRSEAISKHPAYLRLEIPLLLPRVKAALHDVHGLQFDRALYTDTDVIFTKKFDLSSLEVPRVISIGPEHKRGEMMNSGVLYMNLTAISEMRESLLQYADSKRWWLPGGTYDQGVIVNFYANVSQLLPDEYNWKGYWGISSDASIIHFHGPKPGRQAECFATYFDYPGHVHTPFGSNCSVTEYQALCTYALEKYDVSFRVQSLAYQKYLVMYNYHLKRMESELVNL
jgi:hypothetical protein